MGIYAVNKSILNLIPKINTMDLINNEKNDQKNLKLKTFFNYEGL